MRILFVDNRSELPSVFTGAFLAANEVVIVPTLAEARASLAAGIFDVALVDHDLDDGKGDDLVRSVRSAGSPPRIIALSSQEAGSTALTAAGAHAVCGKLSFAKIGATLSAVMAR